MAKKMTVVLCTVLILIQGTLSAVGAVGGSEMLALMHGSAEYVLKAVPEPRFGSIGGEWAVFGLARSGVNVPDGYFEKYYDGICQVVSDCNGELHNRKYTEYSRLICALSAIGKGAHIAGYDISVPLGDYEKSVWQGVNGAIWALIALDCGEYEVPKNPNATVAASRELYIERILELQHDDGGFSLQKGNESFDPDITAMALQALAKYAERSDVETAVSRALEKLSAEQGKDGGFSTAESCAQCVIALCELGISTEDTRFVKNGRSFLDALLDYRLKSGGFVHELSDNEANLMATEQAFLALVAVCRYENEQAGLYFVNADTEIAHNEKSDEDIGSGDKIVKALPISKPNASFSDILGEECFEACTELAKREIINGKSEGFFDPNGKMTRAEFAAITVRALGLAMGGEMRFGDFLSDEWFAGYVNTACKYGIVNGVSETVFAPYNTITFEEAATMLSRAAGLCGIKNDMSTDDARDILAGFADYTELSDWAAVPTAVCAEIGIVSNDKTELLPRHEVSRGEIAEMLFNLLRKAELL